MSSRGSLRGALNLLSKALWYPRPIHGNLTSIAEIEMEFHPSYLAKDVSNLVQVPVDLGNQVFNAAEFSRISYEFNIFNGDQFVV